MDSNVTARDIINRLRRKPILLNTEKEAQDHIERILRDRYDELVRREVWLDKENRIDLMVGSVGIEVKIKGSPRRIYDQCRRYCEFGELSELLLITNVVMTLPEMVENKKVKVFFLSNNLL